MTAKEANAAIRAALKFAGNRLAKTVLTDRFDNNKIRRNPWNYKLGKPRPMIDSGEMFRDVKNSMNVESRATKRGTGTLRVKVKFRSEKLNFRPNARIRRTRGEGRRYGDVIRIVSRKERDMVIKIFGDELRDVLNLTKAKANSRTGKLELTATGKKLTGL